MLSLENDFFMLGPAEMISFRCSLFLLSQKLWIFLYSLDVLDGELGLHFVGQGVLVHVQSSDAKSDIVFKLRREPFLHHVVAALESKTQNIQQSQNGKLVYFQVFLNLVLKI